jgi:pyruvate kinase
MQEAPHCPPPTHWDLQEINDLTHYLALRAMDLHTLQARLAMIGVSSLGRSEPHVLASLDKVLGILHRIAGMPWSPLQQDEPAGFRPGPALLAQHAESLFGGRPRDRDVRTMVTLPSEAASDTTMVRNLVATGMDIARIKCAHDSAAEWVQMANTARTEALRVDRRVRVHMDLAGPSVARCCTL